jgi:hypothetical protein
MLVKRVPEAKARECGEVVADEATGELLHYIERPETCAPVLAAQPPAAHSLLLRYRKLLAF